MDIGVIQELIGNYAFPIVCCIALFWWMIKCEEIRKKEADAHKEEMNKMSEALNNNTVVLTRLLDKFDEVAK